MKNIKRIAVALSAGVAFNSAMAMLATVQMDINSRDINSRQEALDKASMAPAPARSLYIPETEIIARDIFAKNDVVVFGELHHSTNYKFFADNPAFFREAAKNGVKSLYIELGLPLLPATEDYQANRLTEDEFKKIITDHFKELWLWGDAKDYAEQYTALCKTAKQYGIAVRPSDFRIDRSDMHTTDVYGIPDIAKHNDLIRMLTLRTMELYRTKTGKDRPVTVDEFIKFRKLYWSLLDNLSPQDRNRWEQARRQRQGEWMAHDENEGTLAAYQDELQGRYIAEGSHEKKLAFIGGSRHFFQNGSIGAYARKNGYEKIAGIELIAKNGAIWRQSEDPKSTEERMKGNQYLYRIRTDLGQIERLPPPAQPEIIRGEDGQPVKVPPFRFPRIYQF